MILLHLSILENRPVLWAEQSRDSRTAGHTLKRQRPQQRTPRLFLYDAGEVGLRLLHETWGDAVPLVTRIDKAIAWLPTVNGNPLASSPLICPPAETRVKPIIMPWWVTIIELSWEHLVHLLCLCEDKRAVARGVVLGNGTLSTCHRSMMTQASSPR